MAAFLSSLLSELMVQHSSDAIVIECDRATMPTRSLRKRTRPSTRPSYDRSAASSSSEMHVRSQNLNDTNKTQTNKLPVIYNDSDITPSSPPTNNKMMGMCHRTQTSPCSVLCVNEDPPTVMPHRSARWFPSKPMLVRNGSDSALTCPKRPGSL